MPRCSHCDHEQPTPFGRCPQCGASQTGALAGERAGSPDAVDDPDRTVPVGGGAFGGSAGNSAASSAASSAGGSAGGSGDRACGRSAGSSAPRAGRKAGGRDRRDGRLTPGTILLDRYRIRDRLGAGAMGEVYLAEDLTLDQDVALKFLPPELEQDPARQQRFLQEVRLARQVSHPNVCRVYDVGEVDGRLFLSMEYVRGRDLASVLRSIGRLPQEKALDLARQLCGGLAALHDRGVLHRDLKPANVMLDDDGRLRITDFGLAGVADEIEARDIRSGTPLYMAPEQLAGREVTVRSDLYALGLVLYEVFTGAKAFEADTLEQLEDLRRSGPATRISSVVEAIDPAVERVIGRCLEHDPARRPPSALAVATALPGGDPLAAALAMGETPSPELVAAAGGAGGLRPAVGLALLAVGLLGVLLTAGLAGPQALTQYLHLDRPAAALEERARQLVADLGYTDAPRDRSRTFARAGDQLWWFSRHRDEAAGWGDLAALAPNPLLLVYRQSPTYLVTQDPLGPVTREDPPPLVAGMVEVVLDADGRLVEFTAVPAETVATALREAMVPDAAWDRLFGAAGLDRAAFLAAEPGWIPPVFASERRAWRGDLQTAGQTVPATVEAAGLGGQVVSFRLHGPWFTAERTAQTSSAGAEILVVIVVLAVLAGGVTLALRNFRRGRTDLRGAGRVATVLLLMPLLFWIFSLHHAPLPGTLLDRFLEALSQGAMFALLSLMLYLALEPVARRVWPQVLIGWTRLLSGGWRDPMVGRSLLLGGAMFGLERAIAAVQPVLLRAFDARFPPPSTVDWLALTSSRAVVGSSASMLAVSLFNVLFFLLLLVLLRLVLRKRWLAYGAFVLLTWGVHAVQMPDWRLAVTLSPLLALLWSVVLVRGGLLAFAVGFYLARLVPQLPLTLDMSQAYAATSLMVMVAVAALLVFGLSAALGGRPLLRDDLPPR